MGSSLDVPKKVPSNILRQPFKEVPIHTSGINVEDERKELEQLRETVALLTSQCAQLDEANRAWQQYQQAELHVFISKLRDFLPITESTSFDEVAQHIIDQVIKEREDFNLRHQALEKELNHLRSESGINVQPMQPSDVDIVNQLNEELLAIKEAYKNLDAEKQLLVIQLESLSTYAEPKRTIEKVSSTLSREPLEKVPIHTTSTIVKEDAAELEHLRETVALLTSECAQLDESNRTWQQIQFDNFRNKLHNYIPINENISFDDIAQQIIVQMIKDRESFNEKYSDLEKVNDNLRSELTKKIQSIEQSSTDNIDELSQELFNLRNQIEELEKINKQLVLEKENLFNPLTDRSIVLGHHSALEPYIILEETSTELEENSEPQTSSSSISNETEEINKIRSDLALITCQFNQLTQTNENELDSFRSKLQNWIFLPPNSTLDDIAQQLNNQFEEKFNLQTIDNHTQTIQPSEKIHMSVETIPIIYDNRQTQIDPIDMIDQEIQTESFQQLCQHEIEKLQEELAQFKRSSIPSHVDIPLNEDIQSLQKIIEQQSEELKDLSEKYLVLSSQLELQNEFHKQKKETEEKLKTYENQIQHLIHEHEDLVEELQKKTSSTILKIDNECQTDDQQHDKLTQINIKLKRVLQTFKDKIHRIVVERPELFINISEDTSERLDHLISTVEYQATQINRLQTDHASAIATYEEQLQTLIQERNALIEQPVLQSIDNIKSLLEIIEQQSEQLRSLNEKYVAITSSQHESQAEFDRQRKQTEEQIFNYENQIQNLIRERTNLLEERQKTTSSPFQITDHEKQKDDQQYDKLLKINTKLKRVLQTFKEKIHRIATERPNLFTNISEETSERLDHLITIVENQAIQIETLQNERNEIKQRFQYEINEIQNSFDRYRQQIDNEYQIKLNEYISSSPLIVILSRKSLKQNLKILSSY
ncbi:unnamed protein product [Rotaria sp. Silwood1]|nr:unnamed protein product [Rotaria sp. Silwood1]